ncbi:hypothetical protein [Thioalkalivibrio sp.]|uniref:hypothetical protein n=1 Tax=Thioalkalivibrio sp. TaxID=2093813 RepID=UPI00356AD805
MKGKRNPPPAVPGWAKVVITLVVIVGAAALIFTQLPRGAFPTDLSRIGQGTPALVVARDISFVAGAEVMDLLGEIRPEYAERVEFLAVNLGNPNGQQFARRQGMRDGSVVLFSGDGTRVGAVHTPRTEREVRELLQAANIR